MTIEFAVFVKPWKGMLLPELASHVKKLGFSLIELPVRPGFPCEPDDIEAQLPITVKMLADEGVRVLNATISLPLDDERLYAACAAAGISMNRVIFSRNGKNYWDAEADARRQLDAALPFCEQYGVQIGVQHHCGTSMPVNAMGLHHLVSDYDPAYVGAIWDPAHSRAGRHGAGTGAGSGRIAPLRRQPEECLLAPSQRSGSGSCRMAALLHFRTPRSLVVETGGGQTQADKLHGANLLLG